DQFTDSSRAVHTCTGIDAFGHGTHVAGIIAGAKDAVNNIAGVAPNCRILAIKIFASGASETTTTALEAQGIADAVQQHANVINLSLGEAFSDPTEQAAINAALSSGA